jgi:hypothetical protein
MSATSRLKQLLFIAAALALVSLGLVAAISTVSPARADEPTCVPTQDSYSDWANEGDQIRTEENNPPGANGDLVRYVFVGETDPEVITPGVAGGHYSWNGGNLGVDTPPTVTPPHLDWQLNTDGEPAGHLTAATWFGTPGVGLHVLGNSPSNASWFYTVASVPAVTDTDFLWQKQTRTFTEGVDCPDPGPDCEQDPTAEGCPPVDNGKKIVVCKYTGTPPGGLSHIIVVSENTLNNVLDDEGNPFTGSFPFEWTDAQGQAGGSIAIRFAVGNEQPTDLGICPQPPVECPEGDHNGQEPGCDEPPVECPDGDHNGQEPGCGEPDPGPDCEEDPTQEHCEEDDKDCEEDPTQEHCEEDDKDCEEDPNQDKCDEDNNPPVVVPDDGTTPNNSPSNGPTVRGASATAPSAAPGTTVAGTPAAQVPTAVNAGLAPQELAGDGGTLGLLGIATALLGAALVGLTFRPKRRIGAALRART